MEEFSVVVSVIFNEGFDVTYGFFDEFIREHHFFFEQDFI
jgi:hypothetical protein